MYFIMIFLLLIFMVYGQQRFHPERDYCLISNNHTMCKYEEGGGSNCEHNDFKYLSGLTEREKRQIIQIHNLLRVDLVMAWTSGLPSAANMNKLVWDDEAAMIAQRWANQCREWSHDSNRDSWSKVSGSQNLYLKESDAPFENIPKMENYSKKQVIIYSMIMSWYDESRNITQSLISNYTEDHSLKNFTQLAWATTERFGCGFSWKPTDKFSPSRYKLVCNYYPAGNQVNQSVFEFGLACSKCPVGSHCSKKWVGLCTSDKDDLGTLFQGYNERMAKKNETKSFWWQLFGF